MRVCVRVCEMVEGHTTNWEQRMSPYYSCLCSPWQKVEKRCFVIQSCILLKLLFLFYNTFLIFLTLLVHIQLQSWFRKNRTFEGVLTLVHVFRTVLKPECPPNPCKPPSPILDCLVWVQPKSLMHLMKSLFSLSPTYICYLSTETNDIDHVTVHHWFWSMKTHAKAYPSYQIRSNSLGHVPHTRVRFKSLSQDFQHKVMSYILYHVLHQCLLQTSASFEMWNDKKGRLHLACGPWV